MHIALRKSHTNGALSIKAAHSWDELKLKLWKLDYHDTSDWDAHSFAWEKFRAGEIINDGASLWRYIDLAADVDVLDSDNDDEPFDGRVIWLQEIDG